MTFTKGNALLGCVNQALSEMKADGTLQSITTTWLSKKTNVGKVPVFSG
jgi:ABC-type amino acid transport substrate-binding protein